MNAFVLVMVGLMAGLVIFILLLGRFYPGSGAEQLDWRPTRSPEVEIQNEIDDEDQMRAAINAKRAKRGAPPLGEEDIHRRLAEDQAVLEEHRRRRDPGR